MKQIQTPATIERIEEVTDFINGELEAAECSMKAQLQIDVAVDEIFSNIAKFAYAPSEGDAIVQVDIDSESRTLYLTFIDSGTPYNPLEAKDPDVSLSSEERNIGGLGIYLVKKTMDDVKYEYLDGHNRLTLVKKI